MGIARGGGELEIEPPEGRELVSIYYQIGKILMRVVCITATRWCWAVERGVCSSPPGSLFGSRRAITSSRERHFPPIYTSNSPHTPLVPHSAHIAHALPRTEKGWEHPQHRFWPALPRILVWGETYTATHMGRQLLC